MAPSERCIHREKAPCFFFKLPPELRNEIYSLAVALHGDEDPVILTNKTHNSIAYLDLDLRVPGIVYACRQTRDETLALYFSLNTFFLLHDATELKPLISTTRGEVAMKHMVHIENCWAFQRRGEPKRIKVDVEEDGRVGIELRGMPYNVCVCGMEDSLQAGAEKRVREAGGKMDLSFGVMLCLEEEHVSRLETPGRKGPKEGMMCGGCGKATWAPPPPRRSARNRK